MGGCRFFEIDRCSADRNAPSSDERIRITIDTSGCQSTSAECSGISLAQTQPYGSLVISHAALNGYSRRGLVLLRRLGAPKQEMGALAGLPRYSGSVISLCELSRSRISALEQLGEDQGGARG